MKSRDLRTIHDLIVSNYTVVPLPSGRHLHQFTPSTTSTIYQFETNNSSLELVNGDRYNIGFVLEADGRRVIEPSSLGRADTADKSLSYMAAQKISSDKLAENKGKNDSRVKHQAKDGYYWGRKYAWRRYGLVISKNAFFKYLEEINHPSIPCITTNADIGVYSNEHSIAYKDDGLKEAMDALIETAEYLGRYYKSEVYSKSFQVRPINAISDKK